MLYDAGTLDWNLVSFEPSAVVMPRPTLREIAEVVCAECGLKLEQMRSTSREWGVSHPRQEAMWLARRLTRESYPVIARDFGKGDHTTAIYAYRKIEAQRKLDQHLAARLDRMEANIIARAAARQVARIEVVIT